MEFCPSNVLVFSKWARHRDDVGKNTGFDLDSRGFRGGSCQLGIKAIMSARRARTRGRGQRWALNTPSSFPSPPPSPLVPSPQPSSPAEDNVSGLRHVLSQFTSTITTALRGRRDTESS
ncbi:unnamed protein product [Prunus armeniaca]